MKKTTTLILLTFLLITVLITGCNGESEQTDKESGSKEGGTLIVGLNGNPQTFNPDSRADDTFYPVAQNIFSRLVKIDGDEKVVPDLAKEWDFSEDGTTITFDLHENVKWHDGKEFSCSDVKFTLESIMEKTGPATTNLKNMKEVTCPDDNTVVIELSQPDAEFLGYIAWYGTFIVPEHIYAEEDWDSGTSINPIGTGPFKFVEYSPENSLTLERYDDYFDQVAYVDKLIFSIITDPNTKAQSFYNGDLDILGGSPPRSEIKKMLDDPEINAENKASPRRHYITFNLDEEPFNDLKVRQAVAYAIDNEAVAKITEEEPAKYFISPVFDWALSDDYTVPEYNPEKSEELLKQAGYSKDKDGYYLSISFDVFESGSFVDIAKIVQSQLRESGIDVELNVGEIASWQEKVKDRRDYQMSLLAGYQGPDVGAISFRVASDGTNNFMGYNNPELDQILEEGSKVIEQEERATKYQEAQRILSEDLPIYPVTELVASRDPHHSYVKGHIVVPQYNYIWLDK